MGDIILELEDSLSLGTDVRVHVAFQRMVVYLIPKTIPVSSCSMVALDVVVRPSDPITSC